MASDTNDGKFDTSHWAQDMQWTSNERRIEVHPPNTEERHVNVKSLSRINVIFDVMQTILVLNVQKTYKSKLLWKLNLKALQTWIYACFEMTNYNSFWMLCQDIDSTFKTDVTWMSCSEYHLTRKDAVLPEVEQDSMPFGKFYKYLFKICAISQGLNAEG